MLSFPSFTSTPLLLQYQQCSSSTFVENLGAYKCGKLYFKSKLHHDVETVLNPRYLQKPTNMTLFQFLRALLLYFVKLILFNQSFVTLFLFLISFSHHQHSTMFSFFHLFIFALSVQFTLIGREASETPVSPL